MHRMEFQDALVSSDGRDAEVVSLIRYVGSYRQRYRMASQ